MNEETREMFAKMRAARLHPLRAIGGGPWRVLADCPSLEHNYLTAARGRRRGRGRGDKRCVCPRALALLAEFHKNEKARKLRAIHRQANAPKAVKSSEPRVDLVAEMIRRDALAPPMRVPDLSAGLCLTEWGQRRVEAVEASNRHTRSVHADSHRAMCKECPVQLECLANVLRRERGDAAGTWSGIFGGLWPGERKVLVKRIKAATEAEAA